MVSGLTCNVVKIRLIRLGSCRSTIELRPQTIEVILDSKSAIRFLPVFSLSIRGPIMPAMILYRLGMPRSNRLAWHRPVHLRQDFSRELRGDLAAILSFTAGKKKPDLLSEAGLPVTYLPGTRLVRSAEIDLIDHDGKTRTIAREPNPEVPDEGPRLRPSPMGTGHVEGRVGNRRRIIRSAFRYASRCIDRV
jgi:hypothetical protein